MVRVAEARVNGGGGGGGEGEGRGEQKEQTNNGLDLLDLDGYVDLGLVLA